MCSLKPSLPHSVGGSHPAGTGCRALGWGAPVGPPWGYAGLARDTGSRKGKHRRMQRMAAKWCGLILTRSEVLQDAACY